MDQNGRWHWFGLVPAFITCGTMLILYRIGFNCFKYNYCLHYAVYFWKINESLEFREYGKPIISVIYQYQYVQLCDTNWWQQHPPFEILIMHEKINWLHNCENAEWGQACRWAITKLIPMLVDSLHRKLGVIQGWDKCFVEGVANHSHLCFILFSIGLPSSDSDSCSWNAEIVPQALCYGIRRFYISHLSGASL